MSSDPWAPTQGGIASQLSDDGMRLLATNTRFPSLSI